MPFLLRFAFAVVAAAAFSACAAPAAPPASKATSLPPLSPDGALLVTIAADYRVGPTDMRNDYGWVVEYGHAAGPILADHRRSPGGGAFSVSVREAGASARPLGAKNITVLATYPSGHTMRFAPMEGVEETLDAFALSSSVSAQRVTMRNTRKTPVRLALTATETARGVRGQLRTYVSDEDSLRVTRQGGRDQQADLFLPGASSFAAYDGPEEPELGDGPLPNTLPTPGSAIVPTASYTFEGDSVDNPLDDSPNHGDARWTAWSGGHASDWYAVDFNAPRALRAVTLDIYADRQGCWPPQALTIQYWDGAGWKDAPNAVSDPIPPDGGNMTVRFDAVTTTKVRAVFVWQGNGRFGGIRHFRTDPPLPALDANAASTLALRRMVVLKPGQTASFVATLVTQPPGRAAAPLTAAQFQAAMARTQAAAEADRRLLVGDASIDPFLQQQGHLVSQTLFRPEGRLQSPWFAFARGGMKHPGWTEDHQHAHEGLAYIPLAMSDPNGLKGILRSFFKRQTADGRVPYESGPYDEGPGIATFPDLGLLTWRLYKATGDTAMLREFAPKLAAFHAWWGKNRYDDATNLYWWGSFESTRDGANPEDLRGPTLGIPGGHNSMTSPDITALMYADARFLSRINEVLGRKPEAAKYADEAAGLKKSLEFQWDEAALNYQYRARKSVQSDQRWVRIVDYGSLLPLWAGMVDDARAKAIIRAHVLNQSEMWRKNGMPSLSAAEPEYTAQPTSSTWNGQLWIQWNALFVDALLQYGFPKEADALARKVATMQRAMLTRDHHFYECYSADTLLHTNAVTDYNWGAGNIQPFHDIATARKNGKFSIYD